MEFNEKLQSLRLQKGLTQEELAKALFVSRTAISKWESGRGYPSIDSLKEISKFFGITLDSLLTTSEAFCIAEEDGKQKESRFRDLIFALLDLSLSMLLFLPFFAERSLDAVKSTSLIELVGISPYLKIFFIFSISLSVISGILTLALVGFNLKFWNKNKNTVSLLLNTGIALLFIFSLHPYAAAFSFSLLIIKVVVFIKKR